jgi:hypothetical protein
MWVRSRQFTGRIVTVSNPDLLRAVFNYTRDFPFYLAGDVDTGPLPADRGRTAMSLSRQYLLSDRGNSRCLGNPAEALHKPRED